MKDRTDSIDVLRGIMAYIIVTYHSFLLGYNFFPGGGIATEFFFLVTGALMNRSLIRNNKVTLWLYIKHKFSKIIPLFYFTSITTLIVKWVCSFQSMKSIVCDVPKYLFEPLFLRMAGVADQYYINPVTWYLSALFLATIYLYPLARKYRVICSHWIFPLISISLCSFLIKEYGTIVTVSTSYSYFSLDLVKRAIAEVCLGFSLYEVAILVSKQQWTKMGIMVLRVIEIIGYLSVLAAAVLALDVKYSIWVIFALGCAITISFSGYGISLNFNKARTRYILAEFSLSVYLSHYSVILIMGRLKESIQFGEVQFLLAYLLLTTIVSIINMFVVNQMKKLWPSFKRAIIVE